MKKLLVILLFFSAVFCYGRLPEIYEISASSELSDSQGEYSAQNLIDHTWRSWAENSKGNGVGEYINMELYSNEPYVAGFALKNGYGNIDYFAKNNRVKTFKIYITTRYETYTETITVKDSVSFEQYYFKRAGYCKNIRFVIDDVYPGTMYNDTCIAEITLLDKKYDEKEFYENILLWLSHYDGEGEINTEYKDYNRNNRIASVADADKIMILDYLPFDLPSEFSEAYTWDYKTEKRILRKSKIARLNGSSSLRLNDNLSRIDGATALYPLYSSFVRAVYPERQPVENKDHNFLSLLKWDYYPNLDLWNDRYWEFGGNASQKDFKSIVQCNTTSNAYQRLINGETDIIFCYEPSDAEIKSAAEKGKRFNLTPICKDAFIFIVNEKNIANNISLKQIRDIYSGRVTNWKPISGVDEPVIAYQRPENSGSQTVLQSIMKGDTIIRPVLGGEYVSEGMFGHIRMVASDFYNYNCAIGYSFLYYMNQMAGSVGVKALSVDGIMPNKQSIQNNSYPFTQTVYAVTTGNESENTKKFIEWILSPQGQELAEKTGYIPFRR